MTNPMYAIILDEMARTLKISKKELESDIKEISEYWENCLQKAGVVDRDTAIFILTTCVNCYLRGKGIRLGNFQMFRKNNGTLVTLVTLIPLFAWGQPSNRYPKIYELMPVEIYTSGSSLESNDILAQAEKILRDKWEDKR
jgi:hypothetical protein